MKREIRFDQSFKDHIFGKVFVSLEGEQPSFPLEDCNEILAECHEGAVCIASNTCSDSVMRISNSLPPDRRQYLLLSEEKGMSAVMGNKFIRTTKVGQKGMVIINIVDGNPDVAWLFPSSDARGGYKIKDKVQCEALYRSFCNLFWLFGDKEYRGNSKSIKADSVIGQEIPVTDRCCMEGSVNDIFYRFEGGSFYADDPEDMPKSFCDVYVRDCDNPGHWADSSNYSLKLFEGTHGFSMVAKGNDGYLLPSRIDNGCVNWSIHMVPDQVSEFVKSFVPGWEYKDGVDLTETIGKEIRYLSKAKEKIPIKKKDSKSDGFICSTVEEYLDDKKSADAYLKTVDLEHPVAETMTYNITLDPPRLPGGAVKDALYESWAGSIKQWKGALNVLSEDGDKQIRTVHEGTDKIGLTNELNDLKAEVSELAESDLSLMGTTRIEALRQQYSKLCDKFEAFRESCDKAIQKKKFEDDKKEKIATIQSDLESLEKKQSELKEKLKGQESIYEKDNAKRTELDKKIKDLDGKIAKADKKDKKREELLKEKKNLTDERDKMTKEINEINRLKGLLEQNTKDEESKQSKLKEAEASVFEYRQNPLHAKNRLTPKNLSFPDEPLPRDDRFILYSEKSARYITVPSDESDKILTNDDLIKDSKFYKATIVVR